MSNERIKVSCGNLGVINPLGEKLMMNVRRGDRTGEMIALKGCEALEYRWGFLAGLDVFRIELEKVKYRRAFSNRGALKHASKGWETCKTGSWEAGWASASEWRGRGGAGVALEGGIKLITMRSNRGRTGGHGRSKGRRSRGGGGEMRDRRSGAGGWREDGGMEQVSRRGKQERIDNSEERSREAGPQEVAGERRDMTAVKGFP